MCNIDAIFCKLLSWRALISYLKNRKLNFLQNKWQFLLLSRANCVWADPSLPLLSCAKSPDAGGKCASGGEKNKLKGERQEENRTQISANRS